MAELNLEKLFRRGRNAIKPASKITIDDDVIMMTGETAQTPEEPADEDADNVVARINRLYDHLSKAQKKLASFSVDEYDKTVYLTAAKIAKEVGTSESTVVRFAERLGYEGFPEFQRAMREYVEKRFGRMQRVNATYGDSSEMEILHSVMNTDIDNIRATKMQLEAGVFKSAVDILTEADTIYVIGLRSCMPAAQALAFYLNLIRGRVVLLNTSSTGEIFEQMLHMKDKDALVGISFPRYSMRTLKAMEYANDHHARVIAITDSVHSPMNLYSSCNLFAKSGLVSIVDSLTAPMSLVNALIVALCVRNPQAVKQNLDKLENSWENYQTYRNDEMEYVGDRPVTDDPLWRKREGFPFL